ncbi:hypothetical protein ACWT_5859 [Actinoplanes sp. SE50]|uniref:hypothetical protein n=1 Tax=unclassified Actinoplanes TaxID=2626549 RepID=UPI00023EBDCF|nr:MULTISPECIES: hypothetical protein [unclassified Actinoplanes]AEV86877.1 hypothetical protein ACPL_5990 [Actinoplanes sp. SE50/110]ATO85274.1 hypothetical protein ACWT_5859 [Actinoplanes sp. SE50]SLM02684.1 hypothetical protein ACSP50_5966 [Actinoplanes sp. SE50/110]
MQHIHTNAAELMSARNGTTTFMTVADGTYSNKVAFDVKGGEMAPTDGLPRVVLTPDQFQKITAKDSRDYQVTADDGSVYAVSVWA